MLKDKTITSIISNINELCANIRYTIYGLDLNIEDYNKIYGLLENVKRIINKEE